MTAARIRQEMEHGHIHHDTASANETEFDELFEPGRLRQSPNARFHAEHDIGASVLWEQL